MALGIIFIAFASIAFGIGPVITKELIACGLDTIDIMLFPKISMLLVAGAFLLVGRISLKITKKQLWQLLLFSVCFNGITGLLLIQSYIYLPIGLATMFHFIYPVVVTFFMIVLYKEKASALRVAAIILALAGLCLILDLSGNMSLPGVALALGSGFAYATYVIANRKSAYRNLPVLIVVFYSSLATFVIMILIQLTRGRMIIPSTTHEWILITANGLFSDLFAFFMLITGIRRIGASNGALANMLEPITALVAGAVVYGDRIELKAICGCIMVLLAITFITINNNRLASGEENPEKRLKSEE